MAQNKKQLFLNAAITGILAAGLSANAFANEAAHPATAKKAEKTCPNACKGKSECHTEHSKCKGLNDCAGKGQPVKADAHGKCPEHKKEKHS